MTKKANAKLLAEINAIQIPKEELWELARESEEHNREHPGDHGFGTGMFLIARRVKRGEFRRAFAIWSRMNALANLLGDAGAPGWTLPELPDGGIPTEAAVFSAAAVHPLVERDGDYVFERASFLDRVLELAKPQTCA